VGYLLRRYLEDKCDVVARRRGCSLSFLACSQPSFVYESEMQAEKDGGRVTEVLELRIQGSKALWQCRRTF
jgi:hypothetical protein